MKALALVLALGAGAALAEGRCHSNQECAPFERCTTSRGACGSDGAREVCVGTCQAGLAHRVVLRAEAVASWPRPGAGLRVEWFPPISGHALALSLSGWTTGLVRAGVTAWLTAGAGARLGLEVAGATTFVAWGAASLLRVELFPWALWPGLTMTHWLSVHLEGGVSLLGGSDLGPLGAVGVSFWWPAGR